MSIITEAQKKQYNNEGYMILENLFTADEMKALMIRIDKLDQEREAELKKLGQQGISIPNQINFTHHLHRKDDHINDFIMQEKFVDITTSVLGPDVRLYWDQSVYKRPEANRDFPWHQDTGYIPVVPEHYVTCWLAIEDATVENGCVWVQPGTHHQGLVEHKQTEVGKQCYFGQDPGIPVELKKGSMVVFNSLLFHRSTPNMSKTTRKGYTIQYSVVGAKNPITGQVYENGPIIAIGGKAAKKG